MLTPSETANAISPASPAVDIVATSKTTSAQNPIHETEDQIIRAMQRDVDLSDAIVFYPLMYKRLKSFNLDLFFIVSQSKTRIALLAVLVKLHFLFIVDVQEIATVFSNKDQHCLRYIFRPSICLGERRSSTA